MELALILPIIGNILSAISVLPEIIKVHKSWNARSASIYWVLISLVTNIVWVAYGVVKKDMGIGVLGGIFVGFYSFLLFVKMTPKK